MHIQVCLKSVVLYTGVLAAGPMFVTPCWISMLGKNREQTVKSEKERETPIRRSDVNVDKL